MGRVETGKVFEQRVLLKHQNQQLIGRRVVVRLDQSTRDGDTEIAVFTNLPPEVASGCQVARLYRDRWQVEHPFQVVYPDL